VFHISVGGTWSFVWGAKLTKDPRSDGIAGPWLREAFGCRGSVPKFFVPSQILLYLEKFAVNK